MRRQLLALASLMACVSLVRADGLPANVQTAFAKADEIELYSLDPRDRKPDPTKAFHGWKVLGKTTIKDKKHRESLVTALKEGIREQDEKRRQERAKGLLTETGCFMPRHGIRVAHAGKTFDLVICFECQPIKVFVGEKQEESVETTGSPQPTFDQLLRDAGIKLSPSSIRAAFEKASQVELYSLDPIFPEKEADKAFHGWKVLGKLTIKDEKPRKLLAAAVDKGFKEGKEKKDCFQPRHGIRIVSEFQTIDLVICFQCYKTQIVVAENDGVDVSIANSPQPALDKLLTDAGIKLAPKPEK
jgi:hypothetical protein